VPGPIPQAAREQFCRVVPIEVKGVEDVGIAFQRILFLGLLKEDEHMFGVFNSGSYQPRTACISSAGAGVQVVVDAYRGRNQSGARDYTT